MQTEKTSVYLKIVNDFKRKIDLGLYGEGEQLPSCRDLAFKMGINPNTVQRAYTVLEEDGFIFTQPKKGVYVAVRDKKRCADEIAREKLCEIKNSGIDKKILIKIIDEIWGDGND